MGKFIGPGYVRLGPITAGPLGVGCLVPILTVAITIAAVIAAL